MSGSLYQYTPYQGSGQPESPGQAFRSGFVGGQQIETNAMRMDEMRQLAQMRELQEQRAQQAEKRAQALEARTAAQFPLTMKQTALGVSRAQQLLPQELRRGELTIQGLERTIAEQNAAIAALRAQVAPPPVAAVAPVPVVPGTGPLGATPGFTPAEGGATTPPPVAAPATVTPPAAAAPAPAARPQAPLPVAPRAEAPSWVSPEFGERRFAGVNMPGNAQLASAGVSDYTGLPTGLTPGAQGEQGATPEGGAPATEADPVASFLRTQSDAQLREIIARGNRSFFGAPGAAATAMAREARLLLAQRAQATPTERATYTADGVGAPFEAPTSGASFVPPTADQQAIERFEAAQSRSPAGTAGTTTARTENAPLSLIYDAARIGSDQRRLTTEYGQLQRRYQTALAARDRATMDQIIGRMNQINQEMTYLNGMSAITQFQNGNAAPLAGMLHQESNGRLAFQPRADGTFNVFLDGRLSRQGVTRQEIETSGRMLFDTNFQQQVRQERQQRIELAVLAAREAIQQRARVSAEGVLEEVKARLRQSAPELDVQRITDASGQQSLVVVDKRTGQVVGGSRIIQVPPPPGSAAGTQPTFTIEPLTVGQR